MESEEQYKRTNKMEVDPDTENRLMAARGEGRGAGRKRGGTEKRKLAVAK